MTIKALHARFDAASLRAALEQAYAHDGLSLVHIAVHDGPEDTAGMGAYGSWNVGNWVDDVQARYVEQMI